VFSAGILCDINSTYYLKGVRNIKIFAVNTNFLSDSKNIFYKNLKVRTPLKEVSRMFGAL
jgi:hypothetical protein